MKFETFKKWFLLITKLNLVFTAINIPLLLTLEIWAVNIPDFYGRLFCTSFIWCFVLGMGCLLLELLKEKEI